MFLVQFCLQITDKVELCLGGTEHLILLQIITGNCTTNFFLHCFLALEHQP